MKNKVNRALVAMKKHLYVFALCALVLSLFAGCKKSDSDPETFAANVARPSWTAPAQYDYTSSMTAVIKVDLKAQYPDLAADWAFKENDLLAAFSGDKCLGVATLLENGLLNLYIAGPAGDGKVSLRYWSAQYKNLFEAKDVFPFVNDGRQGTPDNPFVPAFVVAK